MTEFWRSLSRRCYVGIASVVFAVALTGGSAHAGGWEEFVKRCLVPMEVGEQPAVIGLDTIDGDPVGQAFDLPGDVQIAIRPPYLDLGLQCVVTTKPVQVAKDAFDDWIANVITAGRYMPDNEIQGRWLTRDDFLEALALDVWQEADQMIFQLSFLETQS